MKEILKVSARSIPQKVARAIVGVINSNHQAEIHVVGAGAVNQATKAIAIARGYVSPTGTDLICAPSFIELDQDMTGIRFVVEPKRRVS